MTSLIDLLPPILPSIRSGRSRSTPPLSTYTKPYHQQSKTSTSYVAASVSKVVDSLLYLKDGLTHHEREEQRLCAERGQLLRARMLHAESFTQWDAAANELDVVEGNEEWKTDTSTGDYNPDLLELRLKELDIARTNCDLRSMMYLIRTSLSRDLGGMGNIDLYRHSHCGTKKLIERYVDSALQTITTLVDRSGHSYSPLDDLGPRDLLDAMLYARQSFGRSALLLSGGGTFGMTHIGVLKAMWEAKLLPRIISGASAGSIVCSVFCCKTDDEIPAVMEEFPYGDLAVFEEEGNEDRLLDHLRRMLTEGSWSDIKHLTRVMRDLLGDITFQEAYNRTRRICNICVSTASIYELPRLLNYVTAPNVMIWSAVAASCSVPLVFSAAALLVKNPLTGEHSPWNPTPQMWIDGSVDNDLPMTRLSEMFNVNHFIVSQVNPHVVPFLAKDDARPAVYDHRTIVYEEESDWLHTMTSLAKSEALHRMQLMAELGVFPNLVGKLRSILSQKYSGDINIIPAIGVLDLPNILKNPTVDFMTRSCLLGERATWPKLSRIRDRCAIELALDHAVHDLRARVVFSKSQVDLRRMATGSLVNTHSRGSHVPLTDLVGAPQILDSGVTSKDRLRYRHRRSSGSNLITPVPHYISSAIADVESPNRVTDADTDDEERLEIMMQHPRSKPKMKLKKIPKHSAAIGSGPKTGPAIVSTADCYDFSRPLTPTLKPPSTPLGQSQSQLQLRPFLNSAHVSPTATTKHSPTGVAFSLSGTGPGDGNGTLPTDTIATTTAAEGTAPGSKCVKFETTSTEEGEGDVEEAGALNSSDADADIESHTEADASEDSTFQSPDWEGEGAASGKTKLEESLLPPVEDRGLFLTGRSRKEGV
ncbi:acyl transferase/acyl hydrolase/lysophospholipase [Xylariaceae sp. FL0255]|nr:acyl transferase/acyl hydrolase/lysophospholipase [Xylariaceae sp. FL0255]